LTTGIYHDGTSTRTAEAVESSITAFAASLADQFGANQISLTTNQQTAGDSSNNGSVTAFDASQIARYQLSIPVGGSIAGSWKFSPASFPIPNLMGNAPNQNGVAILVGDVSGNWTPSVPSKLRATPTAIITV